MPKAKAGSFKDNDIFLPITMQQFQDLTNEIMTEMNVVAAPNFTKGDYVAQLVMSTLHALDHKNGRTKKSEIFLSCVNRMSCHVTYAAVQEIQRRLKEETEAAEALGEETGTPLEPEAEATH